MNKEEFKYFEDMSEYKVKEIEKLPKNSRANMDYLSIEIRNTARDALSGQVSPNIAKKEISDLIESVNKSKKEVK